MMMWTSFISILFMSLWHLKKCSAAQRFDLSNFLDARDSNDEAMKSRRLQDQGRNKITCEMVMDMLTSNEVTPQKGCNCFQRTDDPEYYDISCPGFCRLDTPGVLTGDIKYIFQVEGVIGRVTGTTETFRVRQDVIVKTQNFDFDDGDFLSCSLTVNDDEDCACSQSPGNDCDELDMVIDCPTYGAHDMCRGDHLSIETAPLYVLNPDEFDIASCRPGFDDSERQGSPSSPLSPGSPISPFSPISPVSAPANDDDDDNDDDDGNEREQLTPTTVPTVIPTLQPTSTPTTSTPTIAPVASTSTPTNAPTTSTPTSIPTINPTTLTSSPTTLTSNPTLLPTVNPTLLPTNVPSTALPTTQNPTEVPTATRSPTDPPTGGPTSSAVPVTLDTVTLVLEVLGLSTTELENALAAFLLAELEGSFTTLEDFLSSVIDIGRRSLTQHGIRGVGTEREAQATETTLTVEFANTALLSGTIDQALIDSLNAAMAIVLSEQTSLERWLQSSPNVAQSIVVLSVFVGTTPSLPTPSPATRTGTPIYFPPVSKGKGFGGDFRPMMYGKKGSSFGGWMKKHEPQLPPPVPLPVPPPVPPKMMYKWMKMSDKGSGKKSGNRWMTMYEPPVPPPVPPKMMYKWMRMSSNAGGSKGWTYYPEVYEPVPEEVSEDNQEEESRWVRKFPDPFEARNRPWWQPDPHPYPYKMSLWWRNNRRTAKEMEDEMN